MKKYLPFVLLLVGAGVLIGAFLLINRGKKEEIEPVTDEKSLRDIPPSERPIASLIPSDDGHWLKLTIEKIVIDADSLDYELLYKLPDGRTQGVPGTIQLEGQREIERDLLLGSESSGKFRYDEGVEQGTLTLRFRDENGKLIAKFFTDFLLQSNETKLAFVDEKFTYSLASLGRGVFFVTMETFGVYEDAPSDVAEGPYGVFSSSSKAQPGTVSLSSGSIYRWTGTKWEKLSGKNSSDVGIFIGTSQ